MKLERLGSFHPTRISFTRTLVRRMHAERWSISIASSNLDESGYGDIEYAIETPAGTVTFIAYSNPLDSADRTDRVIAERWDLAFTLFNGEPSDADIERLRQEVPKQEAGRMSESEIVLSRANKSVRLFQHVADALASGVQPSAAELANIGYLIRTTAVYGNGKFGLMDFDWVRRDTPFGLPFQAEMLTVYMARQLSLDLVQHIARCKGGDAFVPLERELQRAIGVGNATGLGMAPFLISHPQLIHKWISTREIAVERIRGVETVGDARLERYRQLLHRVQAHIAQWHTDDERQGRRIAVLRTEVQKLIDGDENWLKTPFPWRKLGRWLDANASIECVELAHSVMLELYPELINELDQALGCDERPRLIPDMPLTTLKEHVEQRYAWALELDFSSLDSEHLFWYVSEEKEEPRLGERHSEPGKELELRIGIGREASRLYRALECASAGELEQTVGEFLLAHPQHRFIITRIQTLMDCPYGEIQDNLIGKDCLAIDLLRCKLAIFGATRFDPKSDRWTRITLFQGAPLIDELSADNADDWAFPSVAGGN